MTVTKACLTAAVQKQLGLPRKKFSLLIESFIETIKATLTSGEDVRISRFGKFSVENIRFSRKRNQEDFGVLNREITFKCSPVLSKKLNGK